MAPAVGLSGGERPAVGEQLDRVEVVEVERERGDQQRGQRDQQQRQGDPAEAGCNRWRRRSLAASVSSAGIACSAPVATRNMYGKPSHRFVSRTAATLAVLGSPNQSMSQPGEIVDQAEVAG